jgi:hypothetical protein
MKDVTSDSLPMSNEQSSMDNRATRTSIPHPTLRARPSPVHVKVPERINRMIVHVVLVRHFSAVIGIVVTLQRADQEFASRVDEERGLARCGLKRGADQFEAFDNSAAARADDVAGAFEQRDV